MTTFVTRKTVRDALVTLFTATTKWQKVFGYMPSEADVQGQSPLLVIRSGGTQQAMNAYQTNPTAYRLLFKSFVICEDPLGSWTEAQAEDKLDELDTIFRQTIRNNVSGVAGADYLRIDEGVSTTGYSFVGNWYRVEEWVVWAHYVTGS